MSAVEFETRIPQSFRLHPFPDLSTATYPAAGKIPQASQSSEKFCISRIQDQYQLGSLTDLCNQTKDYLVGEKAMVELEAQI